MITLESFATAIFQNDKYYQSLHPVNFFHAQTREKIPILMKIDTGNPVTRLRKEDAVNKLGIIDIEKGAETGIRGSSGNRLEGFYMHELPIQIGNLEPIISFVRIGPTPRNLLGRNVLSKYITLFSKENVQYTEGEPPKLNPRLTNVQEFPVSRYNFSLARHPVIFYNVKTGEEVEITMDVDTGADVSVLDEKYIEILGIDKDSITPITIQDTTGTKHTKYNTKIFVRIGQLKPFVTPVQFGKIGKLAILGRKTLYQYKVLYTRDSIRYSAYYNQSSLAPVNFRKRI